ncbi:PTS system D-fructose-specific IIA component (F1P-forming), Frc family /PTS system D-fructose-specific IIB component (F1P-forming), Frc family /PTS system D-fructose-specific IIC component (F1P-forming), Frc family [Streptomyces sp. MnatMP-M77]|uniref:PTS fructose transporter subunit IIABC n=1 Tax=unclassified Streptomyces TaxID=2593676 RepID=UPI00080525EF|nr:fructose-specific PTS transporter subunit EIIC [Streptomyces sp. MnatMP-M77]MYT82065.1 PTS transporter subunit EIIA [Streptomyces sp. SID8364]SBV07564.1 PTS system D-fructose-specific IIA component (F1P-forming), Frc family /PTS system D-fructose-specific IIB component (F1P-forming), Frc family /PTS system D-fructose-specific IIC component (F1P-forming), Frc family [Streptomyces sp. MnatMP-M77]
MSELITAELVDLDLSATTKDAAARSLAERMVAAHRVTDLDGFLADVAAREAQMPTGLDGGIGIPHCRSEHVTAPTLAFGRSGAGIDFGAADGPADLIFLIAAPAGADDDHLTILSGLARRLMDPEFTAALRAGTDPAAVAALIRGEEPTEEPAPGTGETEPEAVEAAGSVPFRIVAVTSCPTGIAHTYMAAESLTAAGRAEGVEVTVETQGSGGFKKLDPGVVAAADAVIWAHDVEVREKSRFRGKPLVDVGVKAGINRPAELIAEARRKAERGEIAAVSEADGGKDSGDGDGDGSGADRAHFGVRLRTYLMSGVSYMVPFVAAGGLLIALSFAIGGYETASAESVADHFVWGEADSWAALLNQIGSAAFAFLVPVLAGYIAYGMADRPALVPGFVGGSIALTVNAGFLGGLVAGLLAGAVVMAIQRVPVHATLRGIMPVLVIPLIASAVVGFLMFIVVGKPIASLQSALTDWLNGLSGSNAVILGVVLGLMMCFDMGGPLNKVAYAFAVGGLADPTDGSLKVMAAVMAAGMVPPLAMALATTVRQKLFTKTERENGRAAWVLGASFITEGAIPFAAADPLRVIPSMMAGGAVTGALSMAFGATLRAPHGGVFVVPLIGEPFLYLLAIAAGTLVATALVVLLKGARRAVPAPAPEAGATGSDDSRVTVAA